MSDCRIIGLGNPLMGDDGAGLAVLEALRAARLAADVEPVDAGTIGMGLLHLLEGVKRVILIDAVDMGLEPGAVRRFTPEQVALSDAAFDSLHQAGVAQVLLLAREMGMLPEELVLVGIQPERIERRSGLSRPVAAAVELAVELVLKELG